MTNKIKIKIPYYVKTVARILIKEGHQAYLVGGCIRDTLLGIKPKDYEIATDAHPNIVLESFPKSIATGLRFGAVSVLSRDKNNENIIVDVVTFRSEEKYTDGRWPAEVKFERNIDEDLKRRDFTVNAFAIDLSKHFDRLDDSEEAEQEYEYIDLFNGTKDLENKLIKAVGDPVERFTEDGLRPFRACRFASVLGFTIEKNTLSAISKTLPVCRMISMERIREEFMKILLKSPKPSIGIELLRNTGLLEIFIPELLDSYGVKQLLHHSDDVYNHLLKCVDIAEDRVKLAALFHDIAKPIKSTNDGHFYGHDIEGEFMTKKIMKRMKFSNDEIDRVSRLVRNHMFYYPYEELTKKHISEQSKYWTDSAVRRFIKRVGEDLIDDLFSLRIADATSNPKTMFDPEEIKALQTRISEIREKDMALKITDLVINGNDLTKLGFKPSPEMGEILEKLLDVVIEDPKKNDKKFLLEYVKKLIK